MNLDVAALFASPGGVAKIFLFSFCSSSSAARRRCSSTATSSTEANGARLRCSAQHSSRSSWRSRLWRQAAVTCDPPPRLPSSVRPSSPRSCFPCSACESRNGLTNRPRMRTPVSSRPLRTPPGDGSLLSLLRSARCQLADAAAVRQGAQSGATTVGVPPTGGALASRRTLVHDPIT